MSLYEWLNHFRAIKLMADGPVNIQLAFGGRRGGPPLNADGFVLTGDPKRLEADIYGVEVLYKIMQLAQYDKVVYWSYEELRDLRRQTYLLGELIIGQRAAKSDPIEFDVREEHNLPEKVSGLYITYIDLKDEILTVVFYIVSHISGSSISVEFLDPESNPPYLRIMDRNAYVDYVHSHENSQIHPMILHSKPPVTLPTSDV